MTVLWIIVACLVAVVWVLSIVDIIRRRYPTWTTIGWIVLIVILPFLGTLIYWGVRKPTRGETEQEYLAQADLRRSRGG